MKKFETMSELDILRAAETTILNHWVRECKNLERNPLNGIANFHMKRYWAMFEELRAEIVRLESDENYHDEKEYMIIKGEI